MKIRQGFVSNSSSSSFICCICNEEVSGWDYCLEDAQMYSCENGHTFCESHMDEISIIEKAKSTLELMKECEDNEKHDELLNLINLGDESKIEDFLSNNDDYEFRSELPSKFCPICSFKVLIDEDIVEYLKKDTSIKQSEAFAEIKKENKRRKKLYPSEYIAYVCKKVNKTREGVVEEMRAKFNNYEELYKFLEA
jgi:hypothetical protein